MKTSVLQSLVPHSMAGAVVLMLAACGGGGGGGDTMQTAPGATGIITPAATAPTTFTVALSGAQEVPPNASAATGTGTVSIDPASRQLSATVTTKGIAGTAAHIHDGAAGVSGPILFPMTESPAGSGIWTVNAALTDVQMAALNAGRYYVNVHSAALPAGEIRAQIVQQAAAMNTSNNDKGGGSY